MKYLHILAGGILLVGLILAGSVVSASPYAYVPNRHMPDNTVSIIDTANDTVIKTLDIGTDSYGVAVSPDGSRVFVGNEGDHTVSVIDTSTNTVIKTISVGFIPKGIAVSPDGLTVYVAGTIGNTVEVINISTNTSTGTINLGTNPQGIAVNPDGLTLYVASLGENNVSVINTATNSFISNVSVGTSPFGIAVTPDGSKVYVANNGGNTVSVINASNNSVAATVGVGPNPKGIAVSPDGSKVYVANNGEDKVSVINTATNSLITTVSVGWNPCGISVTPDGSKVYVANGGEDKVSVINTATYTVTQVSVGESPYALGQFIQPPSTRTADPVITTPVTAGATSVNGTAAAGASIVLRYNGVRQAAVTATGGSWTVTVPALATTDTLSVTAWKSMERMSAPVNATVTLVPPTVTAINPASGANSSTTSVTITGTGFNTTTAGGTVVNLTRTGYSNVTISGLTPASATSISATIPANVIAGIWNVTVVNPNGQTGTNASVTFTVTGPPLALTAINPASGANSSTTSVTITGTGFNTSAGGTVVNLTRTGYSNVTISGLTPASATSISATIPANVIAGIWNVTVVNPDGQTGTNASVTFTVTNTSPTPTPTPVSSGSGGNSDAMDSGRSSSWTASSPGAAAGQSMTFAIDQPTTENAPGAIITVAIVPSTTLGTTNVNVIDVNAIDTSQLSGRDIADIASIELVGLNPSSVSGGTITFAVTGSWLTANGLTPQNVVLMRDHDGAWAELPTSLDHQIGNTYYFTATTPGFSYFAIASRTNSTSANSTLIAPSAGPDSTLAGLPTSPTTGLPAAVPSGNTPVATQTTAVPVSHTAPAGSSGISLLPIVAGIVLVVIAAIGAILFRRWWIRRQNPALFQKSD